MSILMAQYFLMRETANDVYIDFKDIEQAAMIGAIGEDGQKNNYWNQTELDADNKKHIEKWNFLSFNLPMLKIKEDEFSE